MDAKPISFLIVEDDEVDHEAILRSLKALKVKNPTRHAKDGSEALHMLRGTNGQEKLAEPVLMFLDLNLPKVNGIQVLETIQDDPELQNIDVVVVTTSRAADDIKGTSKAFPIKGYLVKDDLTEYLKEFLEDYDSPYMLVKTS